MLPRPRRWRLDRIERLSDRGIGGARAGASTRIEGLHVADASLFPTIPTANIHLAVLMIGERFGEWLRDSR